VITPRCGRCRVIFFRHIHGPKIKQPDFAWGAGDSDVLHGGNRAARVRRQSNRCRFLEAISPNGAWNSGRRLKVLYHALDLGADPGRPPANQRPSPPQHSVKELGAGIGIQHRYFVVPLLGKASRMSSAARLRLFTNVEERA